MENQGKADIEARLLAGWRPRAFVALDFETANRNRSSACAVALVRVESGQIVERVADLIRPPSQHFEFTDIHGIRWADVRTKPVFCPVWRRMKSLLAGAAFPARAGMNRRDGCCSIFWPAVPRERGDEPFFVRNALPDLNRSPRARG